MIPDSNDRIRQQQMRDIRMIKNTADAGVKDDSQEDEGNVSVISKGSREDKLIPEKRKSFLNFLETDIRSNTPGIVSK